jgi:uncharacterized protein YecT (DUF1311 family)
MSEGYMRRMFGTIIVIICVLGVNVFAQKKRVERDPCKDPMTQFDINICSRRDYEKADAELNKVYKKLMLELAGFTNDLRPKFQEAQSLWLKYRDSNCDGESSIYEGGSIRPTVYYSCLASVTRERTKRIKAFLVEMRL